MVSEKTYMCVALSCVALCPEAHHEENDVIRKERLGRGLDGVCARTLVQHIPEMHENLAIVVRDDDCWQKTR
jgi:hypothetical protein